MTTLQSPYTGGTVVGKLFWIMHNTKLGTFPKREWKAHLPNMDFYCGSTQWFRFLDSMILQKKTPYQV